MQVQRFERGGSHIQIRSSSIDGSVELRVLKRDDFSLNRTGIPKSGWF
jgi:hypothetical protein